MPGVAGAQLLWINKTAKSTSLSHSEDAERLKVFSQAQRTSRQHKESKPSRKNHVPSHRPKVRVKHSSKTRKSIIEPDVDPFHDLFAPLYTLGHHSDEPLSAEENQSRKLKDFEKSIRSVSSFHSEWSNKERRSLDYYLGVTVSKILTLHRDAIFWTEIVPCLTSLHPAFRHLVVAIASTHELLYAKDPEALNLFALEQCNKATRLILSSQDLGPSWLLITCILVTAYHLLRCDMVSADKSVESGLKMVESSNNITLNDVYAPGTGWEGENLKMVLMKLAKQHGFKLWSPEISSLFDRSAIGTDIIELETNLVKGPFTNIGQILLSYKNIAVELVTKMMRNLARGAYVDPDSTLAQEVSDQMADFEFFCELYADQLQPEDQKSRLELKQALIGFYSISILYYTKVLSSNEMAWDHYVPQYTKLMTLAEEVLEARRAGLPVAYVDRIVNGAVFTLGICSRDPVLRRRAVVLLQSQIDYEDGLVNWLRGMIVDMIIGVEERRLNVQTSADIPVHRRLHLSGMRCRASDKAVCLEYTKSTADTRDKTMEDWLEWDGSFGAHLSAQDIDDCLQGIMATYVTYGKADLPQAPRGYVRQMYLHGLPVPVLWEPGRNPKDKRVTIKRRDSE